MHGEIRPLIEKGLLYRISSSDIGICFDALRYDSAVGYMVSAPEFILASSKTPDGIFFDVLDTWKGGDVTSRAKNGPVLGYWGGKNFLSDDVNIIEVSNGNSGAVGFEFHSGSCRKESQS